MFLRISAKSTATPVVQKNLTYLNYMFTGTRGEYVDCCHQQHDHIQPQRLAKAMDTTQNKSSFVT